MGKILISDIMTREPFTIEPNTDLLTCAKKMIKDEVGSLILAQEGKLKGMLFQRDILWALIKKPKEDLKKIKAMDISPRKMITIRPTATVEQALDKMKNKKVQKLPIVKNKKLLGIVTIRDILNFKPEFYPELEEFSKIREETRKLKRLEAKKESLGEGVCEECGNYSANLYKYAGKTVCGQCIGY